MSPTSHGCYSVGDDRLWGVNRRRKGTANTLAALKSICAAPVRQTFPEVPVRLVSGGNHCGIASRPPASNVTSPLLQAQRSTMRVRTTTRDEPSRDGKGRKR